MADSPKQGTPPVLKVLEALKQASHDLQTNPSLDSDESNSSAIKALLELEAESDTILSNDPNLKTLSQLLARLRTLVQSLHDSRGHHVLTSFVTRRVSTHSLSRLAASIESEIQSWIDRENLKTLTLALRNPSENEDELASLLTRFEDRVSAGFNRELQDLVLKTKLFSSLETILCNPDSSTSKKIREHAALAISALIKFNKDVFVGQVLMGPTIRALITMCSAHSIRVLISLIRSIKSPLVDEIESNGQIPKIISLLSNPDLEIRALGLDCVMEIGYFGRKEAIDAMLEEDLVGKLVELQRSEVGRSGSCVARFAVQLEVGEGLRQREKRAFKQQILVRVREASLSEAEAATIVAEVLWGSSP